VLYSTPTGQGRGYVGNQFQMHNAQGQLVAGGASDPGHAGVGLFFQQKHGDQDKVFVKQVVKGGSAEKEGTVQVGDILKTVDGKMCPSMADLRGHILGEVGTFVALTFVREGPNGTESNYEVSLMRANAEYFGQLQQKARMQEEVERLRQALVRAEQELETLRGALRKAEEQSDEDKQALARLQSLLQSAEEKLRTVHSKLKEDQTVRRSLETQVDNAKRQEMLDAQDVTRMEALLLQAQDKLKTAEESLTVTREQKTEQEDRLRQQRARRAAAESHESELVRCIESKMREDDAARRLQEHTLLDLESQRRQLEAQLERQRELVRARELEKAQVAERKKRAQEQLEALQSENSRINSMLLEAQQSRDNIESARVQAEDNNRRMQEEIAALEYQGRERQEHIEALKRLLVSQQTKWEEDLAEENSARQKEEAEFQVKG